MTQPAVPRSAVVALARRLFPPVFSRLDALYAELERSRTREQELAAQLEQLSRQVERLEAYQQVTRDELGSWFSDLVQELPGTAAGMTPADALRTRLDEALLHAEVLAEQSREMFGRQVGELRSTTRLTQAMAERAIAAAERPGPADRDDVGDAPALPPVAVASAAPAYEHPTPSFDLLYRAFEDLHRGDPTAIRDQQRSDYIELLSSAAGEDLPVADLGCGRGELVELLAELGFRAVGVDSNLGQVVDGDDELFVEDDLFHWLDQQQDASHRAIVSMHVVEHLPLELQIRLVFEARRVLVEGGLLILETPNTMSLSTAATNFWVDPTHQRPVHPLFLEFLALESGFATAETIKLHDLPIAFRGAEVAPELVEDLNSLIFGAGDMALVARR